MAKEKFLLPIYGFTDGLNTEASVLRVLPSELMDGSINVELKKNGAIRRRRPVDFFGTSDNDLYLEEVRTGTVSAETAAECVSAAYIRIPAPDGSIVERLVLDIDDEFRVYENSYAALTNPQSPLQTISRGTHSSNAQKFHQMQFVASGNRVYFCGKYCHVGYFYVDTDNSTLLVAWPWIYVRNLELGNPNITRNCRVTRNGKMYECSQDHTSSNTLRPGDGTGAWQNYWLELDTYDSSMAAWGSGVGFETSIERVYDRDATMTDSTPVFTTIEFFAGRLWLSGYHLRPGEVFYSQVITRDSFASGTQLGHAERFFQYADPWSSTDSDVVDSDGGVIKLSGVTEVKRLLALDTAIYIGSTSSVKQISGPNGIFKATDFSQNTILTDYIQAHDAMVRVEQDIVVFGRDNIWRSEKRAQLFETTTVFTPIGSRRIQEIYSEIPLQNKRSARALYNPSERKVYYFCNFTAVELFDEAHNPYDEPVYFRNVLVYDLASEDSQQNAEDAKRFVSNAFTLYTYADGAEDGSPYIACPIVTPPLATVAADVVVGADKVVVGADDVVVLSLLPDAQHHQLIAVALQRTQSSGNITINMAFVDMKVEGGTLQDWASSDDYAISYTSRAITGVQTMGDLFHKKVATYLYFLFKKIEDGSVDANNAPILQGGCFLRTAWHWATTAASPKYSDQQQIYKPFKYGFLSSLLDIAGHDHVWSKIRVRGRGNALQVILENDGDKDFHLIGWIEQFYRKEE